VVEHLPGKHKALNSNPSMGRKEKEKEGRNEGKGEKEEKEKELSKKLDRPHVSALSKCFA
jgi:hypothetical protein